MRWVAMSSLRHLVGWRVRELTLCICAKRLDVCLVHCCSSCLLGC